MDQEALLNHIIAFYAKSHDANGLPVYRLLSGGIDLVNLEFQIRALVSEGQVDVVWAEVEDNPHIRRLPQTMQPLFHEVAKTGKLENACLYPSENTIAKEIDLTKWNDFPYTLALWKGGAHLDLIFFDLNVLEKYRNDPRFSFQLDEFGGTFTIKGEHYNDENFPSREKAHLRRFGIAYDAKGHRVLGVMLSDLRGLSKEHQSVWKASERTDPCKLNEASFDAWFQGSWRHYGSIFRAITEEIRIINEMTELAFGRPLFKDTFEKHPPSYGVLLRPTKKEFLDFARALDLMLSENLDKDFFPDSLARTLEQPKKGGGTETIRKGTVQLLQEWITAHFTRSEGNPGEEATSGMKVVRRLRSKASHVQVEDEFNTKYEDDQKKLIFEAYRSIRILRQIFANHPSARNVQVPDWIFDAEVRIP